jgi:hypothetical protein
MMGLVLLFGVVLSHFVNKASEQREAVAAIKAAGATVGYDWQSPGPRIDQKTGMVSFPAPSGPPWLRQILGPDYFDNVVSIHDAGYRIDDAALAKLSDHLKRLSRLDTVTLDWSKMTGASYSRLGELKGIEHLSLSGIPASDSEIQHLGQITSIKRLYLVGCPISDDGVKHLKQLPDLQVLSLIRTKITDACVDDLASMKKLTLLAVGGTLMSPQAMADLKARLPRVEVNTDP